MSKVNKDKQFIISYWKMIVENFKLFKSFKKTFNTAMTLTPMFIVQILTLYGS